MPARTEFAALLTRDGSHIFNILSIFPPLFFFSVFVFVLRHEGRAPEYLTALSWANTVIFAVTSIDRSPLKLTALFGRRLALGPTCPQNLPAAPSPSGLRSESNPEPDPPYNPRASAASYAGPRKRIRRRNLSQHRA